jgi:hypothetical protein
VLLTDLRATSDGWVTHRGGTRSRGWIAISMRVYVRIGASEIPKIRKDIRDDRVRSRGDAVLHLAGLPMITGRPGPAHFEINHEASVPAGTAR